MPAKVFIDGRHGTTGLKIDERLAARTDTAILAIAEHDRKNPAARAALLNEADIVFLCLPDDAAKESVALIAPNNTRTRVLDTSTAHRTHPGWIYGMPELADGQRDQIRQARRLAVPGCHASGFILLMRPLVDMGVIGPDYPAWAVSLTGYSGGGKDMIASYAGTTPLSDAMQGPRVYALGLQHKHLPEMQAMARLAAPPVFTPVVGNFAQGMTVMIALLPRLLRKPITPSQCRDLFSHYYAEEPFIRVMPDAIADDLLDNGFLPATACNGTNRAELFVFGHETQILLVARLDNLGKGASGAAIQCMNLMLGVAETTGLVT
jgi:N-acetyl-gamma-glutamyl-phosphate reductase